MGNLRLFTGPVDQDLAGLLDVANPGLLFTGEDNLRVESITNQTGLVVVIEGVFLDVAGQLTPFQFFHTPNSNRTVASSDFDLGEGWIVNFSVRVSTGTPPPQSVYVRVSTIRGLQGATFRRGLVTSGFPTSTQLIGYPGGPQLTSRDGSGHVRSITGATPAAGAEISETVPTNAHWELITFFYRFVASAAVANRTPNLTLDDGTNLLFQEASNAAQTAGQTEQYSYFQGVNRAGLDTGSTQQLPIPTNNRLLAGYRIRTLTSVLQVADQFSIVQYLVREWFDMS